MATAHAKTRPPSAAHRWLPCPISATIVPMYPNAETEASLKGDHWHRLMEDRITFGILPKECDPDAAEAMEKLAEYVDERVKVAGPGAKVYVEQKLDIPETGEFGTADIVIVSFEYLEILDEKSGYVPVHVHGNEQLLTYLLGAIAKFGPRPKYRLAVHQPNYDHTDGPVRFWEPTDADIEIHRRRVLDSVADSDRLHAGPHCKETYCPHRGACSAFATYAQEDLSLGWHTSELKSMDDATLSKALDASDELCGWRTELRAEAMRRIMNMDRTIDGYKVVKGRRSRTIRHPSDLVVSVRQAMGVEWAVKLFPDVQWASASLTSEISFGVVISAPVLENLGSAKHIEDVLKQYARQHDLPRGSWKQLYDNVVGAYISETANGLTLERAIDGRPAHKRGSEFGVLAPATAVNSTIVL